MMMNGVSCVASRLSAVILLHALHHPYMKDLSPTETSSTYTDQQATSQIGIARVTRTGSTVSSQISKIMRPKVKKILKLAKGYRGRSKNTFRAAIRRVEKAQTNMYKGRKMQKRNIRRQWVVGVNAGVRQYGMSYSNFINEANKKNIELNRKVLSDIAANEPYSFRSIIEVIKSPSVAGEPQA